MDFGISLLQVLCPVLSNPSIIGKGHLLQEYATRQEIRRSNAVPKLTPETNHLLVEWYSMVRVRAKLYTPQS